MDKAKSEKKQWNENLPEVDPVYDYDDPIWVINVKRINEGGHNRAILRYYKTPEV